MTVVSADLGLLPDTDVLRPRVWIGDTLVVRVQFRDEARKPAEPPGPVVFLWKSPSNVVLELPGVAVAGKVGAYNCEYQVPTTGLWAVRADGGDGQPLEWTEVTVVPEPPVGSIPQQSIWLSAVGTAAVSTRGTHLAGATIPQFPAKATLEATDTIPGVDADGNSVRLPGNAVIDAALATVAPAVEQVTQTAATVATQAGEVAGATTFTAPYTGAAPRALKDWAVDGGPSIRDWRLSTDPVNDWGSTINRAISSVADVGRDALAIPAGMFVLDQPLVARSNTTILGRDRQASILQKSGGSNPFTLLTQSGSLSGLRLSRLSFDGSRAAQSDQTAHLDLVELNDGNTLSTNLIVEDCSFSRWAVLGHALHPKGWIGVLIARCRFEDGGGPDLYHAIYTRRVSQARIVENEIYNTGGQGIKVVDNAVNTELFDITGNIIDGAQRGINVSDTERVSIIGNNIRNITAEAIRVGVEEEAAAGSEHLVALNRIISVNTGVSFSLCSRSRIVSNVVRDANTGIIVNGGTTTDISGNTLVNTTGATGTWRQITVTPTPSVVNVRICDNDMRSAANSGGSITGIDVRGSGHSGIQISGNSFDGPGYGTSGRVVSASNYTISQNNIYRASDGKVIDTTPLPTSATGLASGTLWNNAGVVSVVP
jgi:hypothetical protein